MSKRKQAEQEEIVEEVEEDVTQFNPKKEKVEICDLPGIGAATEEKLRLAGFENIMAIAVATPGEIVDASGMTEAAARKIINAARSVLEMGFESGDQILKKREKIQKFSVGSVAFDNLLGGGFETGSITECFGEFGSGKTQVGHALCVNVLKNDPEAYAVYIDTENTFRPERIQQMATAAGLDSEEALSRIMVARAFNSDHQMLLTEKVDTLITEQKKKVRLVVVDSLTAHFRAEFIGRGTLAERQQKLNRHMHDLAKVAQSNNICVYVTNQVMAKPDQFFGDPTQAIGGHVVAHASTFRIYLRKGKKGTRVAKLIDSPMHPDGECCFEVTEGGLKDVV